ncbi:MAG: hypothetical protein ACOC32_03185 [Nanoarchaeota archaeon]
MPDAEDIRNAERLVKYGFFKKGDWDRKDIKKREKQIKEKGGAKIIKDGEVDMEVMEYRAGEFIKTSYPDPKVRHVLTASDPNYTTLEKSYLWVLNHVTLDWKFTKAVKVTDAYGSSVGTDHWGVMNTRIGEVQRTISNLMQTIGALVKDLFNMIHELTIWDERLSWHEQADKGDRSGDIALKGAWVDLVDGGPENAGSVLGLARQAGFVTVPDLFFSTFIQSPDDIDKEVDSLEHGNQQVKVILKRKLHQFIQWRDHTRKEIEQRKRFTVQYLRQHISAIELNMGWLTPYLRQMKYLKQNTNFHDSANLISTFDTAKFEIETLCTKKNEKKYKPVVLMNFQFLSFPERSGPTYQYSGFQHAGSMTMTLRGYVWTDEQIENYQKMRNEEGLQLLGEMDSGFKAAMEALGKEIRKYIEQAEGELPETDDEKLISELKERLDKLENGGKDKKKKEAGIEAGGELYQPFLDVGKAFWDMGKMFIPKKILDIKFPEKEAYIKEQKEDDEKKAAAGDMKRAIKAAFVNYRKAHRMITW